jgi:hypothetical protein
VLQLLQAVFVMISALAATAAVRDARGARDLELRERWRREKERRLDALADAVVGVGEAALVWREVEGQRAAFVATQLQLRRAVLDALNPWIDLGAIGELTDRPPSEIDNDLVEQALNEIANNVEEIRDEAAKTWRQKKRELRGRI